MLSAEDIGVRSRVTSQVDPSHPLEIILEPSQRLLNSLVAQTVSHLEVERADRRTLDKLVRDGVNEMVA